jgi:hypothetical protein
MQDSPLAPETLANLDDGERFDWLRLLRCENIGPRTFQVLIAMGARERRSRLCRP